MANQNKSPYAGWTSEQIRKWEAGVEDRLLDRMAMAEEEVLAERKTKEEGKDKKVVYIDMDNVLVDFASAFPKLGKGIFDAYENKDDIPGIFALMEPMEGAVEAFCLLSKNFDAYVLSTSPWANPSAWSDKLEWIKKHLGEHAYKRLILTHHKNLMKGDYLIDDRTKNGASEFEGELIHFGSEKFSNWDSVVQYLLPH